MAWNVFTGRLRSFCILLVSLSFQCISVIKSQSHSSEGSHVKIFHDLSQWHCKVCLIDVRTGRKKSGEGGGDSSLDHHSTCFELPRENIFEIPLPLHTRTSSVVDLWEFTCDPHLSVSDSTVSLSPAETVHHTQRSGVLTLHPGTTELHRKLSEIVTESQVIYEGEGQTMSLQVDFETGEEQVFQHFPSPEEQLAMLHPRRTVKSMP